MEKREITEYEAREWCRRGGREFKSWDGTFCTYYDPKYDDIAFRVQFILEKGN
jgi:hypothetical protein